ncbi:MAG TPA: hypothetical protein VFZ65_15100 [Planctomycetota bacterium]|nr:hypothetical protein [Planctomycetota bacterium]
MVASRTSLGSLVLLFGFQAAASCQDELRERVNRALEEARPALMDHLRAVGRETVRPGELALILLAAIHDGVDADDPVFVKAAQKLAKAKIDETYDAALRLMVCEASMSFPDRLELARADAKELLSHRDSSGAFSYRDKANTWDLSNTQYAALGLRAAKAMGVKIDGSIWAKMAQQVGEQQDSYGGFGYSTAMRRGPDAYASMTAAGIAVLAICRQALGEDGRGNTNIDKHISRGWQWFASNSGVLGSPNERWAYYFHYGLERAAILCDVEAIDGMDWYAKGATMFVDAQLPGGGWRSNFDGYPGNSLERGRGNLVPTAFAILFLRRKFQKVTGPITPHVVTLAAVGPKSKQPDIDACADELVRRGMEAMPDLLWALRSDIVQQRHAAAAALTKIAGESFGFEPLRDADANRDAVRKAELWYLRHR